MNREEYSYYFEAYVWLMCMVLAYGITSFAPLLYAGVTSGISIVFYFYINLIRDVR